MDDDDDDDDGSTLSQSAKKNERFETAIKQSQSGMPYKEIASGLSYSSDWVGKVYRSWRDENRHTEIVPKTPADE